MNKTDRKPTLNETVVTKVGHNLYVAGTVTHVGNDGWINVAWNDGDVGEIEMEELTYNDNDEEWSW